MRRVSQRRPSTLFRGTELPRLLTLVVMLGVLGLLMARARDPHTWSWIAPDAGNDLQATAPSPSTDSVAAADLLAAGPTDEDPQELDAAREEFQAVSDKMPLGKEEMAAYWRLMAWQQHQSTQALLERADKEVTFRKLWQEPQKWRGKLVQIPVHLRQTAKVDDLEENALGLKHMHEVWGWNSDSQPYWYWLVCPQLPPGMSSGQNIYEEATFVGYFLKLLPYEDHQGKTLATPLLIGRLIWHPAADNPLARSDEWIWPWYFAAGVMLLLGIVRIGSRWVGRHSAARRLSEEPSGSDASAVEAWLDHAEEIDQDQT